MAAHDLSFLTDELLEVQREHEAALEQLCRGEQPPYVPTFANQVHALPHTGPYDAEAWLAEKLNALRENAETLNDPVTYRPFALSLGRFDLHFASAVMGCPVHQGETGPVWWTPLPKLGQHMQDFCAPDLDENPLFQEMVGVLRFVAQATEGRIPIELPYVSEPLVAAVDMFGEQFLEAVAAEPELAEHVLDQITTTILDMRRRFFQAAPDAPLLAHGFTSRMMPRGCTLLYGCTTHLVSGETYRKHIEERDRQLFRCHADGGCVHLCGQHTQHLDTWRAMPEVKSLQLNNRACDDLETYWRDLRDDQFVILVPSERVSLNDALRITGGRRLVVAGESKEQIPVR